MTKISKTTVAHSDLNMSTKSALESHVPDSKKIYFRSSSNDNVSALSQSMRKMVDALDQQVIETRAFKENTVQLKDAITLLRQHAKGYRAKLSKINVSPLRKKSLRLAAIMDSAL